MFKSRNTATKFDEKLSGLKIPENNSDGMLDIRNITRPMYGVSYNEMSATVSYNRFPAWNDNKTLQPRIIL